MKSQKLGLLALLTMLALVLAVAPGCKKKMPKEADRTEETGKKIDEITGTEDGTGTTEDQLNEMERDLALVKIVYFDYDRAELRADGREAVRNNADLLRKWENWTVTIEGHCDERGTNEYNLALGERRARAAQRALEAEGIASSRIRTISYGEERPSDPGHAENSWSRNRRAEFRIAAN
ncbi:MAG: peptidoglycan-associated lipoprotein Pal [bacterium]|nr:peptidoglycan-associated lipoprotein Pal [bacterium]MBK8131141.1 peptidoglycan-associated lipoprotein Pal [bacterium]